MTCIWKEESENLDLNGLLGKAIAEYNEGLLYGDAICMWQ